MTEDCGTYRGWQLHKLHKTKICDRCAQAYVDHLAAVDAMRANASGTPGRARAEQRRKYAEMALRVPQPKSCMKVLTGREWQVLILVAQGLNDGAIATELCLSSPTVKSHIRNILRKLGVGNRLQMVVMAYRSGWLAADLVAPDEEFVIPRELFNALTRIAYLLVYGQALDARNLAQRLRPQLPRPKTQAPQ